MPKGRRFIKSWVGFRHDSGKCMIIQDEKDFLEAREKTAESKERADWVLENQPSEAPGLS